LNEVTQATDPQPVALPILVNLIRCVVH
jgi:hypothetical protein